MATRASRSDPLPQLQQALRAMVCADGPRWVVGYSGGPDSSALLQVLAGMPEVRAQGLRAVHVHHGWSDQADAWATQALAVCAALGVDCQVLRVDAQHGSGGPEARARRARYAALAKALADDEVLLTAHHAEDQAETVLLHLLRGAGVAGLAGMRARARVYGVRVWRPWLKLPRALLRDCLAAHPLPVSSDPANADPRYTRVWLRQQLWPVMLARFPALARTLVHTATHLAADARLLETLAQRGLAACRTLDPQVLELAALLQQPADLRLRILRSWLRAALLPLPPMTVLQRLLEEAPHQRPDAAYALHTRHLRLRLWGGLLHAAAPNALSGASVAWDGQPLCLPEGARIAFEGRVAGGWQLRRRVGGERVWVNGVHRSLKSLLQALAVPPWTRDSLWVLWQLEAEGERCCGVPGLVLDERWQQGLRTQGVRLCWWPADQAQDAR